MRRAQGSPGARAQGGQAGTRQGCGRSGWIRLVSPSLCREQLLLVLKIKPGAAGGSGRPSLSLLLTTLAAGSGYRQGPICLSLPGTWWVWDLSGSRDSLVGWAGPGSVAQPGLLHAGGWESPGWA